MPLICSKCIVKGHDLPLLGKMDEKFGLFLKHRRGLVASATAIALSVISALSPSTVEAADLVLEAYIGSTDAPKIEINTQGMFSQFGDDEVLASRITNPTSPDQQVVVQCAPDQAELGPWYISCDVANIELVSQLGLAADPNWVENLDFELTITKGSEVSTWPLVLKNSQAFKIQRIEAALAKPEYASNLDTSANTLNVGIYNGLNTLIPAELVISVAGKEVARIESEGESSFSLSMKGLADGARSVTVEATNEYGTQIETIQLTILKAKVSKISIKSPTIFYPNRDSYLDNLDFTTSFVTNLSYPFAGTGEVSVKDSAGKVLQKWPLTTTAAKNFRYNGLKSGKPYFGKVTISVTFTPKGLTPVTQSLSLTSSPKKQTSVTGTKSFSALKTFKYCNIGFSYRPCNADGSDFRLYSSGGGDILIVGGVIPVPSTTTSWKISLDNIFTGAGGTLFSVMATDSGFDTSSWKLIGNLPTKTAWSGNWSSSWSSNVDNGAANFTIGSRGFGMITISKVTITYKYNVLK